MIPADAPAAAKAAGLRYVNDNRPGIRRVRKRKHFAYVAPDGSPIVDDAELARIRKLAIPPAYEDVWICADPRGHLQATGRDARGRKQYRYHPRWRETRDETKFDRMVAFARALPAIREAVERDLRRSGLPREKALATAVSLLAATAIRIGNEEYARENESYGLTTMQDEHVAVRGATLRFRFRGKSGKDHDVSVHDARLAKIVRRMQDLPGEELFGYLDDDGNVQHISSDDVNSYLREISGDDFTAKDFRTWEGTLTCTLALAAVTAETVTARKTRVTEAIAAVAQRLGNTAAVCKKSYIHPGVLAAFAQAGSLDLGRAKATPHTLSPFALNADERRVLAFVERTIAAENDPHQLRNLLAKSVRRTKGRAHGTPR